MLQTSSFTGFDIIGDVHGCAKSLEALLVKMDYRLGDKGYCYAGAGAPRQAIFVGDLIDRGDEIVQTLAIVKAMVDNGQALTVLGNHEFNALAYHTPIEDGYLRSRNSRSNAQIEATLEQFKGQKSLWESYLTWFKGLPLFLEFEHFRVVHACWDQSYVKGFQRCYESHCMNEKALADCEHHQSAAALAVERLTRGINIALPQGQSMVGRDGFKRFSFRSKYWVSKPQTYQDVLFQPDPLPQALAQQPLSAQEARKLVYYDVAQKPLFIGHYWLTGEPDLISRNIACLDYSAVKGDKLVAYRFDCAQPVLDKNNFIYVIANAT